LTAGLNLAGTAEFQVDAQGVGDGQFDQLQVTGTVQLGGRPLRVTQVSGLPVGTGVMLIDNDGTDPVQGTFQDLADGALFEADSQLFRIRYGMGSGNDVLLIRDDGGVRLTGIGFTTNGGFQLRGLGTNYASYLVESSFDLTNWTSLGITIADPSGLFLLIDSNAFQYPMQFYRSFGP
jgi:hypothetical protein